MRTPFGVECAFFYGDYYRGRNQEECRLIKSSAHSDPWTTSLCKDCPVPGILRANACKNMVLEATVDKGFLGLKKHVKVTAFCTLSKKVVDEPYVGCGICHPMDIHL